MLTPLSSKNSYIQKPVSKAIVKENKTEFSPLTSFIKIADEKNNPLEVILIEHEIYGLHAVVCDSKSEYHYVSLNNICSGHNANLNGQELINLVLELPVSAWTIVYNNENNKILIFPKMQAAGRDMEVTTAGLKSAEFTEKDAAKLEKMNEWYNKLGQYYVFDDDTKQYVLAPASLTHRLSSYPTKDPLTGQITYVQGYHGNQRQSLAGPSPIDPKTGRPILNEGFRGNISEPVGGSIKPGSMNIANGKGVTTVGDADRKLIIERIQFGSDGYGAWFGFTDPQAFRQHAMDAALDPSFYQRNAFVGERNKLYIFDGTKNIKCGEIKENGDVFIYERDYDQKLATPPGRVYGRITHDAAAYNKFPVVPNEYGKALFYIPKNANGKIVPGDGVFWMESPTHILRTVLEPKTLAFAANTVARQEETFGGGEQIYILNEFKEIKEYIEKNPYTVTIPFQDYLKFKKEYADVVFYGSGAAKEKAIKELIGKNILTKEQIDRLTQIQDGIDTYNGYVNFKKEHGSRIFETEGAQREKLIDALIQKLGLVEKDIPSFKETIQRYINIDNGTDKNHIVTRWQDSMFEVEKGIPPKFIPHTEETEDIDRKTQHFKGILETTTFIDNPDYKKWQQEEAARKAGGGKNSPPPSPRGGGNNNSGGNFSSGSEKSSSAVSATSALKSGKDDADADTKGVKIEVLDEKDEILHSTNPIASQEELDAKMAAELQRQEFAKIAADEKEDKEHFLSFVDDKSSGREYFSSASAAAAPAPTSSRRRSHDRRPLTPPYVLAYTAVPLNCLPLNIMILD